MSVTAASIRSAHLSSSAPQGKQSLSSPGIDYVASKKRKEDTAYQSSLNNNSTKSNGVDLNDGKMTTSPVAAQLSNKDNTSNNNTSNNSQSISSADTMPSANSVNVSSDAPTSTASTVNGNSMYTPTQMNGGHMNGNSQNSGGVQYQSPSVNGMNGTSPYSQQNTIDPTAPLPNEIFDLLNDFWRPNELVAPDTHLLNGKFARRSPDGSLDDVVEEEKGELVFYVTLQVLK